MHIVVENTVVTRCGYFDKNDKTYLDGIEMGTGGLVQLVLPGKVEMTPGEVIRIDADVKGGKGKSGFKLEYVQGSIKRNGQK